MHSFFSNRPVLKDKSTTLVIAMVLLTVISVALIELPVIVNIMSNFTTINSSADIVYYSLRGLFGISLCVGITIFVFYKEILSAVIPCIMGLITVMFPLYESISSLKNAYIIANNLSMTIGYGPYLLTIGIYLSYALLCLFTLLYSIGKFRYTIFIVLISVISFLTTVFISADRYMTYEIPLYEVLSFGYTAIASLLPLLLVLSTVHKIKSKRYRARRMRK